MKHVRVGLTVIIALHGCGSEPAEPTPTEHTAAPTAPVEAPPAPAPEPMGAPNPAARIGTEEPASDSEQRTAEATKETAQATRATRGKYGVREYVSPGGPAGVAPVPDYPTRASAAESKEAPTVTNNVTVEQHTTTINNNVFVAPFGYRDPYPAPERERERRRRREPPSATRPLHPTVTTPVHPAVTTPVHP